MVFEERYGERVTCPHCETPGASFEEIPTEDGAYESVAWQETHCPRCTERVQFKRVRDFAEVSSLWLADVAGEPVRRYVIFPEEGGRRILWRMFVEDPLHTFLARQGYYDRHLRRVLTGKGLHRQADGRRASLR
jgi:hypothetical protein